MGFIYIVANKKRGAIYIGVTNNLSRRIYEHKNSLIDGFTKEHHCKLLVYFESSENMIDAITREKQLKNWHRHWKINLIESANPEWIDLSDTIHGC